MLKIAGDVGIESGSLAWKSNAQLFSQPATRYLVVHKATAIYYSSSEILQNSCWCESVKPLQFLL